MYFFFQKCVKCCAIILVIALPKHSSLILGWLLGFQSIFLVTSIKHQVLISNFRNLMSKLHLIKGVTYCMIEVTT